MRRAFLMKDSRQIGLRPILHILIPTCVSTSGKSEFGQSDSSIKWSVYYSYNQQRFKLNTYLDYGGAYA